MTDDRGDVAHEEDLPEVDDVLGERDLPGVDDVLGEDELPAEEPDRFVDYIGRVAVVGFPNVGKSTLVNRLAETRASVVHKTAGVTRDRTQVPVEWNGDHFMVVDTGGIDESGETLLSREILVQVDDAIAEADLVLFVVDAAAGMTAADAEIAERLRPVAGKVRIVANKMDNPGDAQSHLEFWSLGLGEPVPVSAKQGARTGDLLDEIVAFLRERGSRFNEHERSDVVRVGVFGRRNVGKSTLVNAMLGQQRVIVSDIAGTTRDAVDSRFEFDDRQVVLVDTAGLQRKFKGKDDLQYYSEVRALAAADRSDIAILLIDASEGVTEADLMIADRLRERNCATLVALSKWDIQDVDLGDTKARVAEKLRLRPEVMTLSSHTGRNVEKLLRAAIDLRDRAAHRIPTSEFNRFLRDLVEQASPPSDGRGRRLKLYYGTQYATLPPRFRITVNDRRLMTRPYGYFVENRIRETFDFAGCALIIEYRGRQGS